VVTEPPAPRGIGFSFPLGIPLLLDPLLLFGMMVGRAHWWVFLLHALYLGVIVVFLWTAFSRTQFLKIQSTAPDLTRANWILNWMIFFVALPLLLWVFFGLRPLLTGPTG
jgi:hypothetical protein